MALGPMLGPGNPLRFHEDFHKSLGLRRMPRRSSETRIKGSFSNCFKTLAQRANLANPTKIRGPIAGDRPPIGPNHPGYELIPDRDHGDGQGIWINTGWLSKRRIVAALLVCECHGSADDPPTKN
jgi:hypothetical protein